MLYCPTLISFHILIQTLFYGTAISLTVGTCNLWNVMFNWKTRVDYLANVIQEKDIDIIAFQEVRSSVDETSQHSLSQLNEFTAILPEYKWSVFAPAGPVKKQKFTYLTEWGMEGLGILSRKQIVSSSVISLTQTASFDTNPRIALQVEIRIGPGPTDTVNLVVVHLSYDKRQQCQNSADILRTIKDARLQNVIILGDFNAYTDFTGPVDLFIKSYSGCKLKKKTGLNVGAFMDAWLALGKKSEDGLTFSNMPTPGLQSRPDRILVSRSMPAPPVIQNTATAGDGKDYHRFCRTSVLLSRTKSILKTAYDSFRGFQGYSCLHDCGPHGSCKCGICISGGNRQNCYIPDCEECSSSRFVLFVIAVIAYGILIIILVYSVLRILVVTSRFTQDDLFDILGYRCCLFNQQLFGWKVIPRKFKTKVSKIFRLCQLPPVSLMLLSLFSLSFMTVLVCHLFFDSIGLIFAIIPEELFPSDHMMVYSTVSL